MAWSLEQLISKLLDFVFIYVVHGIPTFFGTRVVNNSHRTEKHHIDLQLHDHLSSFYCSHFCFTGNLHLFRDT